MDSAHELIVRSLQGVLTPAERVRLTAWRRAAPENERCFRDLEHVWALVGLARGYAPRPPPPRGHRPPSPTPDPESE